MSTGNDLIEKSLEEPVWFAMSATYGRELKAKAYLESKSVECFIPMTSKIVSNRKGVKTRKLVPAISNLLFVHTTKERIQRLKSGLEYLQYHTHPVNGRNAPIIVPDEQMQQFISVSETHNDNVLYMSPDDINLDKGTPVRVVGGAFDGVEGTFVKVKGSRNKRVVILIQGLIAAVVAEIGDGYITPINN